MKAHRVFAYILDAIIIAIASGIVCTIAGVNTDTLMAPGTAIHVLFHPATFISLVVSVVYFLTDVMYGGSPGKKVFGLAVVLISPEKAKLATALTRALVKVISVYLIFGIILMLAGEEGSSFHDKIAGTRVQKRVIVA